MKSVIVAMMLMICSVGLASYKRFEKLGTGHYALFNDSFEVSVEAIISCGDKYELTKVVLTPRIREEIYLDTSATDECKLVGWKELR